MEMRLVCFRAVEQRVGAGQLDAVHAGEPGESEEAARTVGEAARRDGRADEGLCHGHVEQVQLRQQRVRRPRSADQGRQLQTARRSAEGVQSAIPAAAIADRTQNFSRMV